MTTTTEIDPTLRHGGTFKTVCDPNWPITGFWPNVDALATEHHAAVEAYQEAVAAAPRKPSLADYDRACREAIANGEALPEPPPSPNTADVDAGEVRVRVAQERVMRTASAILNTCRSNATAMAEAETVRGPIAEADARIADLQRQIAEVEASKAPYEHLGMWIKRNTRHPWAG